MVVRAQFSVMERDDATQVHNQTVVTQDLTSEFRDVFKNEFASVCRSLRRLGVSEADLSDVAQELFVTVHRHFSQYDRTLPLRPWIYSFAVRFASNYRKLARHRGTAIDPLSNVLTTSESGTASDARDLVLRVLEQLDDDQRTALVLHDMDEFTAPEIAELLSIPLNTVYSRVRLGRDKFRTIAKRFQGAV